METENDKNLNASPEDERRALDFVAGLVERMGLLAEVGASESDGEFKIVVMGGEASRLIGHRGETLDSLQYLTLIATRRLESNDKRKITVDVEGYRQRRAETLKHLAKSIARDVVASGLPRVLEPMKSADRRVVHEALSNARGVETHSEGEGSERHLVVSPTAPKGGDVSRDGYYDSSIKNNFKRTGAAKAKSFGAKRHF